MKPIIRDDDDDESGSAMKLAAVPASYQSYGEDWPNIEQRVGNERSGLHSLMNCKAKDMVTYLHGNLQ
jgi:hypothetical protein